MCFRVGRPFEIVYSIRPGWGRGVRGLDTRLLVMFLFLRFFVLWFLSRQVDDWEARYDLDDFRYLSWGFGRELEKGGIGFATGRPTVGSGLWTCYGC